MNTSVQDLLTFIKRSPSNFHAVKTMQDMLINAGYTQLHEGKRWSLKAGEKYFITRNASSIAAFQIPQKVDDFAFQIVASHSDSPTFKVKHNAQITIQDYRQLNVEGYGGMIMSSWLDRPLSIAGRAVVKQGDAFITKLVDFNEDSVLIPNVAIHMNRNINDGYKFNPQVDMLPLYGMKEGTSFEDKLAAVISCDKADILDFDVFLYNRENGCIWGSEKEFVSSAKLDDLECAFTSLTAFLNSENKQNVNVFICFDNEEVGSSTKQGADGTMLKDIIERIAYAFDYSKDDLQCAIANSFMVSADNAHSVHPNHPEKADPTNRVYMNKGIVIKYSARQSYTSDAMSAAVFIDICKQAGVPIQRFFNRSDIPGGGTLGNISSHQLSIPTCDIGLAQLAMHSSYETAGVADVDYMIRALSMFYSKTIKSIDNTSLNYV